MTKPDPYCPDCGGQGMIICPWCDGQDDDCEQCLGERMIECSCEA